VHHGDRHSARGGWSRLHAEDSAPSGAHPTSPTADPRRPTEPATTGSAASSHCSSATAASASTTTGHHQRAAGDDLGAAATEAGNYAAAAVTPAASGDPASGTSSTTAAATRFRTYTATAATRTEANIRERRRKSDHGTAAQNRGITERPREFAESVGRTGAHPDAAAVAAQRGKQQPQHAVGSGFIPECFGEELCGLKDAAVATDAEPPAARPDPAVTSDADKSARTPGVRDEDIATSAAATATRGCGAAAFPAPEGQRDQKLVLAKRRSSRSRGPDPGRFRPAAEPPSADAPSGFLFLCVILLDCVADGSSSATPRGRVRGRQHCRRRSEHHPQPRGVCEHAATASSPTATSNIGNNYNGFFVLLIRFVGARFFVRGSHVRHLVLLRPQRF